MVTRHRVLVLASVGFLLLGVCVIVLPVLLVPAAPSTSRGLGPLDRAQLENERLALRNDVRTTLLQAFGGAFFVVTAFLTWRQIEISRQGQLIERFGRAIDHLGAEDKLEVRLGGIYALEQIARNSREEHGPIVEILTAYVRGHASQPMTSQQAHPGFQGPQDHAIGAQLAPLRARAPDVQAVLTVLGRRPVEDTKALEPPAIDLRKAALPDAKLRYANLEATNLSGADLRAADLREAGLQTGIFEEPTCGRRSSSRPRFWRPTCGRPTSCRPSSRKPTSEGPTSAGPTSAEARSIAPI